MTSTPQLDPDRITVEEMSESLTGYDEIAISRSFDGLNPYTDAERNPITVQRALVFVHQRRGGKSDPEAREAAMAMPLRQIMDYFATDDEVDPTDPVTAAGKDEPQPG